MASIHPSWHQIDKIRNKLTQGERYATKYLESNLSDEWDIYPQPFLNGTRPDIVLLSQKFGVIIIEVKDWKFKSYKFQYQKLYVKDKNGNHLLDEQPIEQVRRYSDNLKNLIPYLDVKINKNYKLIRKLVYFHNEQQLQVDSFFPPTWTNETLVGKDGLDIEKLKDFVYYDISKDCLMDSETVQNIRTWLQPPFHSKEQVEPIVLNPEQAKYAKPKAGFHCLRGVTGSGKTLIIACRAAALAATGKKVLIVSFNKTLRQYICDKVKSTPFNFDRKFIVYKHFHGFCNDMLTELSYPKPKNDYLDTIVQSVTYALSTAPHKGIRTNELKYDAILIDEGQDFKAEWIELLKLFLKGRKELFVVCDKAQNIYNRNISWIANIENGNDSDAQWGELSKCIRLPKLIAEEAIRFSNMYLLNVELHMISSQTKLSEFDPILRWISCRDEDEAKNQVEAAYNYLYSEIKQQPTDIVMLFPSIQMGKEMVKRFEKKNINVNDVFDDNHKTSFWMGDTRTKMSTIHSFKGWELQNVIVVVDEELNVPYEVYTAISRAMQNLIVINISKKDVPSKYDDYGKDWPNTEPFHIAD